MASGATVQATCIVGDHKVRQLQDCIEVLAFQFALRRGAVTIKDIAATAEFLAFASTDENNSDGGGCSKHPPSQN